MTKLMTTLTIATIASILIIGGFTIAPNAYSTYGGWGGDDDDCDDYYGYHHDDCDEEPQTGKIIVKKAITNDNGGSAIPADFTIKITNTKTGDEIILNHDQEEPSMNVNEVPVGTYKMSEEYTDTVTGTYTTVLIAGDNKCPSMMDEKFKIKQGKKISCTIYNDDDFVPGGNEGAAPTVKITVQVNNLEGVTADQFEYTIGTNTMIKDGDNPVTIPINTPTIFNQTNFIDTSDPDNLVLPASIEGDGNCPEVLGVGGSEVGLLTLSANQNIECIVVYGKVIEPGVVFHFDSLRFDQDTIFDPNPSQDPNQPDLDKCDSTESTLPCIVFNPNTFKFNVIPNVPTGQLRVTTLVQSNIIAIAADNTMIDPNGSTECSFEGIGISPAGKSAFVFQCQNLMSEENQFRVNFALIETLQSGKTLT